MLEAKFELGSAERFLRLNTITQDRLALRFYPRRNPRWRFSLIIGLRRLIEHRHGQRPPPKDQSVLAITAQSRRH